MERDYRKGGPAWSKEHSPSCPAAFLDTLLRKEESFVLRQRGVCLLWITAI